MLAEEEAEGVGGRACLETDGTGNASEKQELHAVHNVALDDVLVEGVRAEERPASGGRRDEMSTEALTCVSGESSVVSGPVRSPAQSTAEPTASSLGRRGEYDAVVTNQGRISPRIYLERERMVMRRPMDIAHRKSVFAPHRARNGLQANQPAW